MSKNIYSISYFKLKSPNVFFKKSFDWQYAKILDVETRYDFISLSEMLCIKSKKTCN